MYSYIHIFIHLLVRVMMVLLMHIYACEVAGDAVDYGFEVVVVLSVHFDDVFVSYIRTIYYVQLYRTVRYATVRYGTVSSATLRLKTKNRVNVYQKSLTPYQK